jgi:hypothetical protein
VIEINSAPSVDAADFLRRSREIHAAAAAQGLAPYRLYFNGTVADSGGAGQITLGGPSPAASPFLREPRLLPRLVRFLNRHPALSYLYSHDFVGSSGQSVRADERGMDAIDELGLTLALLERSEKLSPELLWHSLAPFLCDASGNSHRAEMNIEKLWNPFLAGRGRQGLVEFRALRMQHTPQRATALACLLRAIVAMLAGEASAPPLIDWGRELHERFALPFYLEQDLHAVLQELAAAGLGLDEAIEAVLLRDEFRLWGQVTLPGCSLEVRRALEFWPLLGDAASPEQGGSSRLVDASTARVELRLRPRRRRCGWDAWQIVAAGVALPLRRERDGRGELGVFGLRYRSFVPGWGLHPALPAQAPLRLRCVIPSTPPTISSRCTNGAPTVRATPACPPTWPPPLRAAPSGSPSKSCRATRPCRTPCPGPPVSALSASTCAACPADARGETNQELAPGFANRARLHGTRPYAEEHPSDERDGNRQAEPTAIAPHLDSTEIPLRERALRDQSIPAGLLAQAPNRLFGVERFAASPISRVAPHSLCDATGKPVEQAVLPRLLKSFWRFKQNRHLGPAVTPDAFDFEDAQALGNQFHSEILREALERDIRKHGVTHPRYAVECNHRYHHHGNGDRRQGG